MAMGCFTVAPLAVRFGKRPVWLGCMTVFFVCHIWAAASQSYASLLVARLLASWAGKRLHAIQFPGETSEETLDANIPVRGVQASH